MADPSSDYTHMWPIFAILGLMLLGFLVMIAEANGTIQIGETGDPGHVERWEVERGVPDQRGWTW